MVLRNVESSRKHTKETKGQTTFKTRRKRALPVFKSSKKESKRAAKDRLSEEDIRAIREEISESEQSSESVEEIGSDRWKRWSRR